MTTAIIHGDPGSYKTSTLVSDFLIPAVREGRVVVTNIRGVKSVEDIADLYGFDLPSTSEVILVPFNDEGFERMARFFHWAPLGALILMDEGQRIYPTRLRDFSCYDLRDVSDRPKTVEDSFDSHRHYNWDIYISTPNISKVHKEIRAVAEFGYRHKNMASLFSFMKGRYKRVTHNAENSGVAMSHEISSSLYKIDPRVFDAYQSTATGVAKDTTSAKTVSVFTRPKFQIMFLFFCAVSLYLVYRFSGDQPVPAMFTGVAPKSSHASDSAHPGAHPGPSRGVSPGDAPQRFDYQNPFLNSKVYLTGDINGIAMFSIEDDQGGVVTLYEPDLRAIGFEVARLSPGSFRLTFAGRSQVVFHRPSASVDLVAKNSSVFAPVAGL